MLDLQTASLTALSALLLLCGCGAEPNKVSHPPPRAKRPEPPAEPQRPERPAGAQTPEQPAEAVLDARINVPRADHTADLELEVAPPIISIDEHVVALDDRRLIDIQSVASAAEAGPIEPLVQQLETIKQNWDTQRPGEPFPDRVILQADRSSDCRVVKKVSLSAAQAGYPHVSFAVRRGGDRLARLRVEPRPGSPPQPDQVKLILQVTSSGYVLASSAGHRTSIPMDGDAYDVAELRDRLQERKRLEPSRRDLLIAPGDAVEYQHMVEAMDAAIGEQFPEIAILDGRESPSGDNIGLGTLGEIGASDSGPRGSQHGPQVSPGKPRIEGSLSRDVIHRTVRRHLSEIRFCYEQQLNLHPDLEGRVTVELVISPTGAVSTSSVADSTLGNDGAEQCIASAVRRWTFVAPAGEGSVRVHYPFVMRPSASSRDTSSAP